MSLSAVEISWGIERLRVPELWRQGLTGKAVRVGHLDTGVDGRHPALWGAVAAFAEFDCDGAKMVPDPAPHDTGEHGTHTAGIIAARPFGGRSVGVAPGAELACGIVIEGGNVAARVRAGIDWAIGVGVRVLSLSVGVRAEARAWMPAVQAMKSRGVLPVVAVGDRLPKINRAPGNCSNVLSVAACDEKGKAFIFAGSQPRIVAPGVNITSTSPGGDYQVMTGSSMATPHIAGLAALLWEAVPRASVEDVEDAILRSRTLPVGEMPSANNPGLPDAVIALQFLTRR